MKLAATVAAVSLCLGAAAVSATAFAEDERIGICHATGSPDSPFVFLLADKSGYEHGHHRQHEGDFFVAAGTGHCDGDLVGNETGQVPDEPGEAGEANDTVETGTDETPWRSNETAPGANATAPANETGGNATAPANETEPESAPAPDAWVRQTAWQRQDEVLLTIQVGSGAHGARDAVLTDNLPDLRRTWHLGGADASACVLDRLELTCWFGELLPAETRQIELRSYTDRMPCGFSMTNTADIASLDDVEPRNDASSASVLARAC